MLIPEIKVVAFTVSDVITTSGGVQAGGNVGGGEEEE